MRYVLVVLMFFVSTASYCQYGYYEEDSAYMVVDKAAEFPNGGMLAFKDFNYSNIAYPEFAQKNKIEGRVFVKFIITEDGFIEESSIKVLKGPHKSFNATVVETIKNSPAWSTPELEGKAVRQRMVIPIDFNLKDSKKKRN